MFIFCKIKMEGNILRATFLFGGKAWGSFFFCFFFLFSFSGLNLGGRRRFYTPSDDRNMKRLYVTDLYYFITEVGRAGHSLPFFSSFR